MAEEKKQWTYSGRTPQGVPLKGNMFASTKEEVTNVVKNMGIIDPIVVPYGEEIIPPPQPVVPAIGPTTPASNLKTALSVPEMSPERKAQQKSMDSAIRGMAQNVESQIGAMEQEEEERNRERRQRLIVGEEARVMAELNPLLKDLRGQILNVNIILNGRGAIILTVVVEHDIEEEKK